MVLGLSQGVRPNVSAWNLAHGEQDLYEQIIEPFLEAMNIAGEKALKGAIKLSSGNVSAYHQKYIYDHPYARRHGIARMDPTIINVRTGEFRDSWRHLGVVQDGNVFRVALVNDSEAAKYLDEGTRFMLERPIVERLETFLGKKLLEEVDRAKSIIKLEIG